MKSSAGNKALYKADHFYFTYGETEAQENLMTCLNKSLVGTGA